MDLLATVLVGIVALATGGFFGYSSHRRKLARLAGTAQGHADEILATARVEADALKREAELSAKEEAFSLREQIEKEGQQRSAEVAQGEKRLLDREAAINKKSDLLDERELQAREAESDLQSREDSLVASATEVEVARKDLAQRLERIAGLSASEARSQLIAAIEDEARAQASQTVRDLREEARRDAEREARKIIAMAVQRLAVDHSSEITVSVVALPNDDMKGRIIGREGRNIRSFEAATGVDVVVDDTPEAVILSSFDPIRREVARVAMERLVSDGRIHPGRIEEVVEKADGEVKVVMQEAAEGILYELGIHDLHPQLVEVLGNLKFRTSYGQNQLQHAKEVALLSANMAAELNLDVAMCKRMGLLHDIGKGLTHLQEGSHVEIGYELCKRVEESEAVLNAIKAHHGEEPAKFPETFLVTAADAISGARPGARRESFEHYVKRLEKLEEIASSYTGVSKVYAIQAGREIRVMVMPDRVSDEEMAEISEKAARRIEEELQYPGQIKVVVVRESRSVQFAR